MKICIWFDVWWLYQYQFFLFYGNICKINVVYLKIVRMIYVYYIVIDRLKKNFCFNDIEYFEENFCRMIIVYY